MSGATGQRPAPQMMELTDRQEIARGVYSVRLIPDRPMPRAVPGTFLDLLPGGLHVLRRPLSIADADEEGYTLIFRVVGRGTDELSRVPLGARMDVLGPLGHGFALDSVQSGQRALLVGGGVGRNDIFWADEFSQLGEVLISTDDGSVGTRGTVAQIAETDAARRFIPDIVQACGPIPMLKWVKSALAPTVRTQLSLEERMACAVGACYACVIGDAGDPDHQFRVCYDGPVFEAEEVVL